MFWVREALDLGQAETARLIGVQPSHLNKIEQGKRFPSIQKLAEFCVRLRVSPLFILLGALDEWTDRELAMALVARHPELAPPRARTGPDIPSTSTRGGGFRPPRRRSPAAG
jgi:transcriptional regulator with XRE-family HTH domain